MEMIWMTMPEALRAAEEGRAVIVPFGVVEQHGPHLPLATDTLQAYGVAVRAADRAGALVAPPVHYGHSSSTRNHPGTVGITADTLRALVRDLVRSFARRGFTRLVLYSGHAGGIHLAALREAAELCVAEDTALRLAVVSDWDLGMEAAGDLVETEGDSHAGEVETSRMMALHPDSVKGTAPAGKPDFPRWRILPDPETRWPGGVWGDPGKAGREKGEKMVERASEALARIVREI